MGRQYKENHSIQHCTTKNCNCVKCTVTASKLRKHMLFVVIYKEIGKTRKITNWLSILIPKRNKNLSVYEKEIESKKSIDNFFFINSLPFFPPLSSTCMSSHSIPSVYYKRKRDI